MNLISAITSTKSQLIVKKLAERLVSAARRGIIALGEMRLDESDAGALTQRLSRHGPTPARTA